MIPHPPPFLCVYVYWNAATTHARIESDTSALSLEEEKEKKTKFESGARIEYSSFLCIFPDRRNNQN
jgi:hypothetical protein